MGEKDIEKLDFDPYEMLELTEECSSVDDVKKAYRKKALQWHPDKNPDRREYAQKMFLQVARASEILLDKSAKAALDRVRKAKREHKQRTQKLDAKRRKLREELEAREQHSQTEQEEEVTAAEKLAQEVERLRRQGSELLKSMREEIERQIREENEKAAAAAASRAASGSDAHTRLKISWPANDDSFDSDTLAQRFGEYGSVVGIVVGPAKKKAKTRTALVEFQTFQEAETALIAESSVPDTILSVSWLVPPPAPAPSSDDRRSPAVTVSPAVNSTPPAVVQSSIGLTKESDFESVVLMRMRQAEERKRLIEQMKQDDEAGE